MTRKEFDKFCKARPAATHVVQWGGASVWKVGGKIFAIYSAWGTGGAGTISFKCSDLAYDVLKEHPGLRPAPYLARAKWIQAVEADALSDTDLKDYIAQAYEIVARKLTRAARKDLGLKI